MFAFAVADRREQSLVLVRDALGIKPLCWWLGRDGTLAFASELRSLIAHPSVPRRVDRRSLEMLLVDRYVADPWTLLEEVKSLPAGALLTWRAGAIAIDRWHTLAFDTHPIDEREARVELERRLDAAVRSQLVADVPVGVFLSGGIDSSTVAAFAARARREQGQRLATFSVGFDDPRFDESALAREVARHLDSQHHEVRIGAAQFDVERFDRILDHVGQPLADTSTVPTLAVSELARQHVTVALSGDGGDEFFGGYDHMFWAARVRFLYDTTPAPLRRAGSAVLAAVAPMVTGGAATSARRLRKGLEMSLHAPLEQFRCSRALWQPSELADLCAHAHAGLYMRRDVDIEPEDVERLEPEELVMLALARGFMPGAILTKVDRMSMAASLEVRPPLLDRRVVEFAMRLPLEHKLRGRTGKHLLREVARPLLPAAVFEHRKHGFSLPLFAWFNERFWTLLGELYAPGSEAVRLFRAPELERVMRAGREADRNVGALSESAAATRVWLLAALARWMQRFGVSA
jgi:asparagine synthase (glutamine-hydrolysing)